MSFLQVVLPDLSDGNVDGGAFIMIIVIIGILLLFNKKETT